MATLTVTYDDTSDSALDHVGGSQPAMPEADAHLLVDSMAAYVLPGVIPAGWWGVDHDRIVAVTHNRKLAAGAACQLARVDGVPFGPALRVDGPFEVVPVGDVRSDADFRPVQDGDEYALTVCVVQPTGGVS